MLPYIRQVAVAQAITFRLTAGKSSVLHVSFFFMSDTPWYVADTLNSIAMSAHESTAVAYAAGVVAFKSIKIINTRATTAPRACEIELNNSSFGV